MALIGTALAAGAVTGCSTEDETATVERWFEITRTNVADEQPTSDELQIDPNRSCELLDEIAIEERPLELFGAATAQFGDIGGRYQCAWSGDATGDAEETAAVRLEVVVIDDPVDFRDYAALIPTREDNRVVTTDVGNVQVASFTPDGSERAVTTSILVDPAQRGGIQLVVELLDPELIATWTPETHAEFFAELAA